MAGTSYKGSEIKSVDQFIKDKAGLASIKYFSFLRVFRASRITRGWTNTLIFFVNDIFGC